MLGIFPPTDGEMLSASGVMIPRCGPPIMSSKWKDVKQVFYLAFAYKITILFLSFRMFLQQVYVFVVLDASAIASYIPPKSVGILFAGLFAGDSDS